MPIYHYRCKKCGYDFTKEQSFSDEPIKVCPQCGAEQVHKVYAAVPITFKGSGFYRTDSHSSSKWRDALYRSTHCGLVTLYIK